MKIVYIGNKLSKHGHPPTSVETLGPLLAEKYDIDLISDKKNKLLRLFHFLNYIISHRKKLKLIIIDTYSTSNFYYAFLVAKLAQRYSIPYIPILRGGNLPERLESSPGMSRAVFEYSLTNIAPSGYLLDEFKSKGFKVEYIPNNIRIKNYPFKKREKVGPRLLFVRSFHKIYNPTMAIEVFAKIKSKYPEAELCLIGPDKDGSLEECKKLAEKLKVEESTTFTGRLSKVDWINKSVEFDIFINTTNFDNHPVSVVEGMALGLPVVTTNVGGVPYLVKDQENGLLVQKGNIEEMTEKIIRLIENPSLAAKLSDSGRKDVEGFDWENVKNKWFELIQGALKSQQN